jgi:hypothetical protein
VAKIHVLFKTRIESIHPLPHTAIKKTKKKILFKKKKRKWQEVTKKILNV